MQYPVSLVPEETTLLAFSTIDAKTAVFKLFIKESYSKDILLGDSSSGKRLSGVNEVDMCKACGLVVGMWYVLIEAKLPLLLSRVMANQMNGVCQVLRQLGSLEILECIMYKYYLFDSYCCI